MQAPDFWTTGAGPWPTLLAPAGWLYAAAGRVERALAHPLTAPVPVICVGNLSAGGTGKTPIALALAALLRARGRAPGFLSRGYGGRAEGPLAVDRDIHSAEMVGDEPLLLAEDGPCWVCRKRRRAVAPMIAAGIDVIVMDDGYQDPALAKDLALVVVDGETGFGNGRCIPAGPLREPVADGLARADAAIVMGADDAGVAETVAGLRPGLPLIGARLAPDAEARALAGHRVFAFAGIGRPEKFRATLAEIGADIQGFRAFPDHHPYGAAELEDLLGAAAAADARPVTTAKDRARLPADIHDEVAAVGVSAEFDDPQAVSALLDPLLAASAAPAAPGPAG